jgi:hypothetical protein
MNIESSNAWRLGNELPEGKAPPRTQAIGHGLRTHRCRIVRCQAVGSRPGSGGGAPAAMALTHVCR